MISVNDNGIGMNDEVRQHLLEPFYTSKASGTGLGLSMVYDFIKEFDGGLRVDSEPGKGTTISLFLPVQEMEIESPKTEDWGSEALPTGNETILLVEDREKLRRFASRILNKLGYHVLEAEDAARALECLEANEGIDLLFSDIIMPGEMNGRQLARQAIIKWPSLSVLLSTGMEPAEEHNNDSSVEFAMLAKPYTTIQLAKSVRNILDS
jgi:CheY-like chemotaxis protein